MATYFAIKDLSPFETFHQGFSRNCEAFVSEFLENLIGSIDYRDIVRTIYPTQCFCFFNFSDLHHLLCVNFPNNEGCRFNSKTDRFLYQNSEHFREPKVQQSIQGFATKLSSTSWIVVSVVILTLMHQR